VQIDTRPVEAGEVPGWRVTQVFDDPAGDRDWRLTATVDLAATDEAEQAVLTDLYLGPA